MDIHIRYILLVPFLFLCFGCTPEEESRETVIKKCWFTEQSYYRLKAETYRKFSTDIPFTSPFYNEKNVSYSYDMDGFDVRISSDYFNGNDTRMSFICNGDEVPNTIIWETEIDGAWIETRKTVTGATEVITYENEDLSTEGYDSVRKRVYRDGELIEITQDGLWELVAAPSSLQYWGFNLIHRYPNDRAEADGIVDNRVLIEYNGGGSRSKTLIDTDGDGSYETNITYSYNDMNDLTRAEDTDGNYEALSYTYDDGRKRSIILDKNGSSTLTTTFDDQFKIETTHLIDIGGSETNTTYTYTPEGKLLGKIIYAKGADGSETNTTYAYSYTPEGELLEQTVHSTEREDYSRYGYNENGDLIRFESTFESLNIGYAFSYKIYTNVNSQTYSDFAAYDLDYDEDRNLIKVTFYDNSNAITTATVEFTWEKSE